MAVQCVGPLTFKSKKDLKTYTKSLLLSHKNVKIASGPAYQFLLDLIKRHPEAESKLCSGVNFFICQAGFGTDDTMLTIHRHNATTEVVSWNTAINGYGRSEGAQQSYQMRRDIVNQVLDYFNSAKKVCSQCNSLEKLDIDHITPFKQIHDEYLQLNSYEQASWALFHGSKATYQLLCKSCHRKKTYELV